MTRSQRYLLMAVMLGVLAVPAQSLYGFVNSSASTVEITRAGLEAARGFAESGDAQNAAYSLEFSSKHFADGLQRLRSADAALTDDLHLLLLDLPAGMRDGGAPDLMILDEALSKLDRYEISEENPDLIIVDMLTVADEEYTVAITDGNEAAYVIAKSLFEMSKALFESYADPDVMLDLEQLSFFDDIEAAVSERKSFVTVGTLVSAIQRDLIGTQTLAHDQLELYDVIAVLYGQLLDAVDSGDYATAEELAIEAYLENFEYLEPTLETVDAEFMYALEIDMREDLRDMIAGNEDPEDIREFLESSVLPDLRTAKQMVTEYLEANPQGLDVQRELKDRGDSTSEQQSLVRDEIDTIRDGLQEMLIHYENGDVQSAYATARTAYLDSYEYVEIPLRPIDPDFTLEVEYQFADLRNLIKQEAPYSEVQDVSIKIQRNLDESERLVTGTGQLAPIIAFTASFAIIFREGLESVLILGAIMTYLEASRNTRFKPYVHYGIVAAIAATAVTWVVASYIVEISGASRELIEAVAALSATAVLFYVSFWILNKIEHKKWMEFVKAKVWQATTTGSVMVFVMLSFFTVYREGFETVLFYQAMLGFAKYMELYVGLGFALGMGSLLLLYYVMRRLGRRLPLRALFGLTMGIGAYLSIAFLGNAVRELQILDVVPYTSMFGTIPRLDINMATMTGIYPTLETVVAQIVLLGVYLVASTYVLVLRPRRERRIAQMRQSRGAGSE